EQRHHADLDPRGTAGGGGRGTILLHLFRHVVDSRKPFPRKPTVFAAVALSARGTSKGRRRPLPTPRAAGPRLLVPAGRPIAGGGACGGGGWGGPRRGPPRSACCRRRSPPRSSARSAPPASRSGNGPSLLPSGPPETLLRCGTGMTGRPPANRAGEGGRRQGR